MRGNTSEITTEIIFFRIFLRIFNRKLSLTSVYGATKLRDMYFTHKVVHVYAVSVYQLHVFKKYYSQNKNFSNINLPPFLWSKIARKKFSELRVLPTRIHNDNLARPREHPQNLPERFLKTSLAFYSVFMSFLSMRNIVYV